MCASVAAIGACALILVCASAPVLAAHPLQTEDTGTQGAGNIEIENGLSRTRSDAGTALVYQPQVSLGLTPTVDLMVQPSWLRQGGVSGPGDTNLDVKWRFFGMAPWSLGVRSGLALATSDNGLGLPHGTLAAHGTLVATYDDAPWTVHANLGFDPASSGVRPFLPHASVALMWAARDRWIWTLDAGASADPDARRHAWPVTLLGGVIYTLMPSLDVDAGYQLSADAWPQTRQWLLGLTYRFAP
jgi:opacity protein-like surface antigen